MPIDAQQSHAKVTHHSFTNRAALASDIIRLPTVSVHDLTPISRPDCDRRSAPCREDQLLPVHTSVVERHPQDAAASLNAAGAWAG
jgi:hypothetical protein